MSRNKIAASADAAFPKAQSPDQDFGIRIGRDGVWFYQGSAIERAPLVKLFASVLERDQAGDFWLITPAERGRITVDDAPFVAVDVRIEGAGERQTLAFRTNLDEWVTASAAHPIRVAADRLSEAPAPYILVRGGLEARIGRAVFYELVDLAVERPGLAGTELGVWSEGMFFPLGALPPEPAI